MTLRTVLLHRSRSALAAAGTIAFFLAGMMQGGTAQAAVAVLIAR
ncbi:hypothetical protein [Sphingomonas montana]|nr:hypothetical protein [Sphingomonas montana]